MASASKLDSQGLAQELVDIGLRRGWEVHELPPIRSYARPWFRHVAASRDGRSAPVLYLSAGVHGDEPAGPLALKDLLFDPEGFQGFSVVMFPLINPEALAVGARENRYGVDCNRDYLEPASPEVQGHVQALQDLGPFRAAISLHEDWETQGAYLYEINLGEEPGAAESILNTVATHLPRETNDRIDGYEARQGIISRHDPGLLERPDWPETLYLIRHHTRLAYTLETPSSAELRTRVQAHCSGVLGLVDYLRSQPSSPTIPDSPS